jgi:hypothetical protein
MRRDGPLMLADLVANFASAHTHTQTHTDLGCVQVLRMLSFSNPPAPRFDVSGEARSSFVTRIDVSAQFVDKVTVEALLYIPNAEEKGLGLAWCGLGNGSIQVGSDTRCIGSPSLFAYSFYHHALDC